MWLMFFLRRRGLNTVLSFYGEEMDNLFSFQCQIILNPQKTKKKLHARIKNNKYKFKFMINISFNDSVLWLVFNNNGDCVFHRWLLLFRFWLLVHWSSKRMIWFLVIFRIRILGTFHTCVIGNISRSKIWSTLCILCHRSHHTS